MSPPAIFTDTGKLPTLPRQFGDYLFLKRLGAGGMGEVYLAKHGNLGDIEKYCVVKTLKSHFDQERAYVARFIDEARVVVQLNHRNICHVFDVGRADDRFYLAMNYVAGRDLRSIADRLAEYGQRLPPEVSVFLVGEILEALDYAHRHRDPVTGEDLSIVHRDVSAQNVMVSFEGEVKLIDFGLAASKLKMEKTQPKVVMGKLAYMSPEQARGEEVDRRTDVYAVGILLYELLSGERFYEGMTVADVAHAIGQGGYRPKKWDALDAELRGVLDLSLAEDALERFPTCVDFKDALVTYQLNHRMRAGTREVRGLVSGLFAKDMEEERAQMATFSQMRSDSELPLRPEPTKSVRIASASDEISSSGDATSREHLVEQVVGLGQKEKTETKVSVPITETGKVMPGQEPHSILEAAATYAAHDDTELEGLAQTHPDTEEEPLSWESEPSVTERIPRRVIAQVAPPRRRGLTRRELGLIAVGGVLIACMSILLWVIQRDAGPTAPTTLFSTSPPPIQTPMEKPPLPKKNPIADQPSGSPDSQADAGQAEMAVVDAGPEKKKKARVPRKKTSKKTIKPTTLEGKIRFLKTRCAARAPCARGLVEKYEGIGRMSHADAIYFKQRVDICMDLCAR
jgi:serine/threonine protein kinase